MHKYLLNVIIMLKDGKQVLTFFA